MNKNNKNTNPDPRTKNQKLKIKKKRKGRYLGLIGQDDKNDVRQRVNGDPLIILENFKSSDIVLDEKRDGTYIGMWLQTQSEV